MLNACQLLKYKILIGLLYDGGLRCLEARSVRLQELDFDRKQWRVAQGKCQNDRYVHILSHTFATHLLEDGMDIITLQNLLVHENIETTIEFLQIPQLPTPKICNPLYPFFGQSTQK